MPVNSRIRTQWTGRGDCVQGTPHGPLVSSERNKVLTDWLEKNPRPISLLMDQHPSDYYRALLFGHDDDDINAACLLGAVEATRKFDPRRGFVFHTYALPWIRSAVQKLCRRQQVDEDNRHRIGAKVERLDGLLFDGDLRLADVLPDHRSGDPAATSNATDLYDRVLQLVRRRLPARYRRILELRWGLNTGRPMTLNQVAEIMGVSRERVRQIEVSAIRKIRQELDEIRRQST